MKINLICVGKLSPEWRVPFELYARRINNGATLNVIEVRESNDANPLVVIQKETRALLAAVPASGPVYLCALSGQTHSSETFSTLFDVSEITFVIGGSHGVDEALFNKRISFSELTFAHQLFRVILVEQIFRALSIKRNSKYHK